MKNKSFRILEEELVVAKVAPVCVEIINFRNTKKRYFCLLAFQKWISEMGSRIELNGIPL